MASETKFDQFLLLTLRELSNMPESKEMRLPDYFDDRLLDLTIGQHLRRYEDFIRDVRNGYRLDISSYLNDLDRREHLEHISHLVPSEFEKEYRDCLSTLDSDFISLTGPYNSNTEVDLDSLTDEFWKVRHPREWLNRPI